MQSEKLWTKDFLGTCFSSLFLFLTFYMLMTTLPVYVIDGLKGKPEEIGLVATVFLFHLFYVDHLQENGLMN